MTTWDKLICGERFIPEIDVPHEATGGQAVKPADYSHFVKDVDYIVFSSAFRRMQRKAQVYIATDNDFLRNRLTHTLEVVSLGRNLGGLIVKRLDSIDARSKKKFDDGFFTAKMKKGVSKRELVEAIAAACHAHDIGNPPFGHIGEYAIKAWFKQQSLQKNLKDTHPELSRILAKTSEIRDDFISFDGNPQGFRILTRLQGWRNHGGLRLTYDTLATFCKYVNGSNNRIPSDSAKFGYFQSEADYFDDIFTRLGLVASDDGGARRYIRHPFSYVMEAADDIAYCCSDIEDGFKAKLIPFSDAVRVLKGLANQRIQDLGMGARVAYLEKSASDMSLIKYLRSVAADALIYACQEAFFRENNGVRNYQKMMEGNFSGSLIQKSELSEPYKVAKSLSNKYVYGSKTKIVREQGAHQIIRYFLTVFSSAIEEWYGNKSKVTNLSDRSKSALMIMHRIYDYEEMETEGTERRNVKHMLELDPASHYRILVDFISGMTDNYAVDLASTLRGTHLGNIN